MAFNYPRPLLSEIRREADVTHSFSLVMLDLYGWLEHKSRNNSVRISVRNVAQGVDCDVKTIRRAIDRMGALGWIDCVTSKDGTDIQLRGIPEVVADDPQGGGENPSGVREKIHQGEGENPSGVVEKIPHSKEPKKELSKKEKKNPQPPAESQAERVARVWNDHRPKKWQKVQVMGTRMKVVDHLARQVGGIEKFLELLPLALAEAASDKWWGQKAMSWANFMGTGNTSKAHFEEMVDRALAKGTTATDPEDNPGTLEHPEFFTPAPGADRLIARSGVKFSSIEDRRRREAEAFTFFRSRNS